MFLTSYPAAVVDLTLLLMPLVVFQTWQPKAAWILLGPVLKMFIDVAVSSDVVGLTALDFKYFTSFLKALHVFQTGLRQSLAELE